VKPALKSVLYFVLILTATAGISAGNWNSLRSDRLHDPSNPSLRVLQEPEEALSVLPPDTAGNKVNWVKALQVGAISPRTSLREERDHEVLDQDILMKDTLPLPYVRFPHRPHTEWMSCENCHEQIFVSVTGANEINMAQILNGQYCGVCHGAVAFPLTECNRCHNTDSSAVGGGRTGGAGP